MKTRHLAGLALAGTGLAASAAILTAPVAAQTYAPPAPAAPGEPAGSGAVGSGTAPAPMPAVEAAPMPSVEPAPMPPATGATAARPGTTGTTVVGEPFVVHEGYHGGYGFPYAGCRTGLCQPQLLPGLGFPTAGLSAPDAGFNVPNRRPIPHEAVRYWKWNPAVAYGLDGSVHPRVLPIVAVPTDTTQLGYYYQRVPAWRPMPGMIPPPPNPDAIHDRSCRGGARGCRAFGAADGYVPVAGPFKKPIDDGTESPDAGYGPMGPPGAVVEVVE